MLELKNVSKVFNPGSSNEVRAVQEVDLRIEAGQSCAIVGESGSGKSTLGRIVLGLILPDQGDVEFDGVSTPSLSEKERRRLRSQITVVFQEPLQSLNPSMRVIRQVEEPLRIHKKELSREQRRELAEAAIERVSLRRDVLDRWPASLSGGEQQRVSIARAIVTEPRLIVLDEPTSSLDVSVRRQVWDVLNELRAELHVALLVISHDFNTVEALCETVNVMHHGRIVEDGPVTTVLAKPTTDYAHTLLDARLAPKFLVPKADCQCLYCRRQREGATTALQDQKVG